MKSINKTQFKIIYYMYNRNEYHLKITNAREIEQAAKLSESLPEVFRFSHMGFREALLSISTFEDIFKLIQYNRKYETEIQP